MREREGKGSSAGKHMDDYSVVDLETTGIFLSSAHIIEISALKVRDNQVVEEFSTLVNPHCHIPKEATEINHISDEMVKDAPDLDDVIDRFIQFLGNDVIVGYNNAGFDINMIYDSLMNLRSIPFSNDYIDILHSARRCLSALENHKLETVSKYYGVDTFGEHRALKDCYLTKDCYDRLFNDFGEDAFVKSMRSQGHHTVQFSTETIALQELQRLLEEIIADGTISFVEFSELKDWMESHSDLQGNYPFDRVFNELDIVLADGKVTAEELEELQVLFSDYVDPVKSESCHEKICTLCGKHVCVTGDFLYGSRDEVFTLIESAGGIVDKGVKKATDYLVVGAKGSENWKTENYGGKIQKALEMIDKGIDIKIIEEKDFVSAVRESLEHPADLNGAHQKESQADWKQEVRDMLAGLIKEYELPPGSLYLKENYSNSEKKKGEISSYAVSIWEPDYPAIPNEKLGQNKIVVTIQPSTVKSRPDDIVFLIRDIQEGDLHSYLPEDAELLLQTKTDVESGTMKVRMNAYSPNIADYVRVHTEYCLAGYVSKAARFGCCSHFIECSDAKKCVHENKLYSKACIYRDSLDKGRIFYGKNRNID